MFLRCFAIAITAPSGFLTHLWHSNFCLTTSRWVTHQTLLGVTGSGKTFTVSNVIAQIERPTLVIAHNTVAP